MNNELIISSTSEEISTALLEDKKLVELHQDKIDTKFAVGDIFLGKVKKIIPGLNAAFVDVGYSKDAFLHYHDLGPKFNSLKKFEKLLAGKKRLPLEKLNLEEEIDKGGIISDVLVQNSKILVQIAKEPISTKGPRLTSELTIAGRYIVLVPFSNKISVSLKIEDKEERKRLKTLIQSIKPNNFGVIVRTVAENKKVAELHTDLDNLLKRWNTAFRNFQRYKIKDKVLGEVNRTSAIIRDLLNTSFNKIHVDDESLFEEIKENLAIIAPEQVEIVKLYKKPNPIFDNFGITKQIKSSFGKTVSVSNGIYLIIEHTEACHVIDVNSGYRVNSDKDQEANALQVNLESAAEIARQLRLRDMGGIIVIDFIDMHESANRKELFKKMKEEMSKDKAKHSVLPPSKFGLIQITRQRVRPETNFDVKENCPSCNGTGEVRPDVQILDKIEQRMKYILTEMKITSFELVVSPFIYAYLTKGIYSIKRQWYFKLSKSIKLKSSDNNAFLEFYFTDKDGQRIDL